MEIGFFIVSFAITVAIIVIGCFAYFKAIRQPFKLSVTEELLPPQIQVLSETDFLQKIFTDPDFKATYN